MLSLVWNHLKLLSLILDESFISTEGAASATAAQEGQIKHKLQRCDTFDVQWDNEGVTSLIFIKT